MQEQILEILKYTLPSFIVLLAVYLIIKQFVKETINRQKIEAFSENQKLLTPLRLQAYERVILFLERITIESLAIRLQKPGMNARQLHMTMVDSVRKEFNHNLSQQLYISEKSWNAVKNSKEQIIRTINLSAASMNPKSKAGDLSKRAMEIYSDIKSMPIESSITLVKREGTRAFGM